MIERLQRVLTHIDELSPEMQEDLAQQIEEMTESLHDFTPRANLPADETLSPSARAALALGGAWRDLQDDDEFAYFERIRHEVPPSPPMEEHLAWLDERRDESEVEQ
jgi:hypothetical protein